MVVRFNADPTAPCSLANKKVAAPGVTVPVSEDVSSKNPLTPMLCKGRSVAKTVPSALFSQFSAGRPLYDLKPQPPGGLAMDNEDGSGRKLVAVQAGSWFLSPLCLKASYGGSGQL